MTSTAPQTSPSSTAGRRWIDWFVAILWFGAIIGATVQQGGIHNHNNFLIFRAASRHLIAGSDLYTLYPAEHADLYKYSPTFALLFAPFAFLPLLPAIFLWNALNAGALFIALGMVLHVAPPTSPARSSSSTCSARSRTRRATRSSPR